MADSLSRTDAARYKIEEILNLVRTGRIRVPRFQRGLRWTSTDVERLFDSIYKGYPIGTLLFWKRPAPAAQVQLGSVVIDAPELSDALWVVDGQQRITSLAASLLPLSRSSEEGFDLAFDLATERFVTRRPHDKRESRIPLRQVYDLQQVLSWLRERNLDDALQDRAFRLADRLRNYEIPAYTVEADGEQALRQIFDRTNTFGKQMTRAEVFHALHTAVSPEAFDLRTLRDQLGSLGFGEFTDNTLLFCVLSVRGPDVLREFRSEFSSDEDLETAFREAEAAIRHTIDFLRVDADLPHMSLVPYQHLTVGLTRFFALHPNPDEWVRVLLRRWFWRSAVHGPIAKTGSTGTLRATMNAITPGDPYASASRLLDLVGSEPRTPEIGPFRWNVADVRISLTALANLQPIDLVSRRVIDVTESIELRGRDALIQLIANKENETARTLASRVFSGVESSDSAEVGADEVLTAIAAAADDPLLIGSHAISEDGAAAVASGDLDRFLKIRLEDLGALVTDFVDARCEWERPLRPRIADIRTSSGAD